MQRRCLPGPFTVIYFLLTVVVPAMAQSADTTVRANEPVDRAMKFVPNEILVRFRDAVSSGVRAQAHAAAAAAPVRGFRTVRNLELVRLPAGQSVDAALRQYRSNPAVAYAEPNYVRRAFDAPNDPMFSQMWNLHNTGQNSGTPGADIHAPEAWALTKGSQQVVVAVIDTGVDYTNEDLAGNAWRNPVECTNNGLDNDGNGYVNDCYGINTAYNNSDPMDDEDHGTHVAGIIGAVGNNGVGITGVNWNVSIMACKFLDDYGYGTDAGAIGCLEYVAMMKDRGVNIVATNNSWGGTAYSQALYDAIDMTRQRGILFIAAAGNWGDTNDSLSPSYPSSYNLSNIIAVAATNRADKLAYFSSYGRHTVHLAAPGEMILSTVRHNLYRVYSGTSMAAPHVTGVAALLAAQDPKRDWKTIRNLILAGGTPLSSLSSETITGRRLNAVGSMTCSNSSVLATLQPVMPKLTASSGRPVVFSALNVNCGAPAGNLIVTILPGGQQITLTDNGQAPDQDANDGIYTGQWTPSSAGSYTFTMPDGQTGTIMVDPYTFHSAQYQYRSITGTGLALDDDTAAGIESPFPISYAGSAYSSLGISDNGVITFDGWFGTLGNKPLPYRQNETLVAPFWDDLLPLGLQRNAFWQVTGSAPNRELVIEWRNLSNLSCSAGEGVTFQTVFFENSPDVLFNYADTTFGGTCADHNGGALATVGVQFDHTAATQYSYATSGIPDQTALRAVAQLPDNPVPTISSISPASWSVSKDPTYLLVKGTNLQPGSLLLWNGKPRYSYYLSDGSLFAFLDYGDLNAKGTARVSVFNSLPGGGASNSLPFTIGDPDFALQVYGLQTSVKVGQSATFEVWAAGNPAWNGAVSLACSNLPANATCSFSPSTISENEYSILAVTAPQTIAEAVRERSIVASTGPVKPGVFGWQLLSIPFGLIAGGRLRRPARRRTRSVVLGMFALAYLVLLVSCGGGATAASCPACAVAAQPATPTTKSYQITVTGTAGSLQHSTTLTLVVTQ